MVFRRSTAIVRRTIRRLRQRLSALSSKTLLPVSKLLGFIKFVVIYWNSPNAARPENVTIIYLLVRISAIIISVSAILALIFIFTRIILIAPDLFDSLRRLTDLSKSESLEGKSEALRHLITTQVAILGGLVAFALVIWRQSLMQRQTSIAAQTYYTSLLTKAIEQLGATRDIKEKYSESDSDGKKIVDREVVRTVPNMEVRLGSIYTLERIARESLQDHISIMEMLCSYIRENSPNYLDIPDKISELMSATPLDDLTFEENDEIYRWFATVPGPRIDIIGALTVIGRRTARQIEFEAGKRLDLRGAWLVNTHFSSLNLKGVNLDGAHLENVTFFKMNLDDVLFKKAHIARTKFFETQLMGAMFSGVHIKQSQFFNSDISFAQFEDTDFSASTFLQTMMFQAQFIKCGLSNVPFLLQTQINMANGDLDTTLPSEIERPDHWSLRDSQ